jgi:glycosyltransferase involved in cell wall biosynthesis
MASFPSRRPLRVALVHDFLLSRGGAERVLSHLHALYPEAPLYTLLENEAIARKLFPKADIRPSRLQRWPRFLRRRYRWFLPFCPVAVEAFDLRDFDLIISSSGAWSKGVVTRLHTKHLAYVHSPMRFAWESHRSRPEAEKPGLLLRLLLSYLRVWDLQAAERPDLLVANSRFTADRIAKFYRREARVVYPAAAALRERFPPDEKTKVPRTHFLVVARLSRGKSLEYVLEAFSKLDLPLIILGEGPERRRYEKRIGKNIRFVGGVSDQELARFYRGARALIQPWVEDFGLAAAEALSFGTPVVALGEGGVREVVDSEREGVFYPMPTATSLAVGMLEFLSRERAGGFDSRALEERASRFSEAAFQEGIRAAVEETLSLS